MAPLPSSFKVRTTPRAKDMPFSWKQVEHQDRAIIKEVCKRARKMVLWTWYRVSELLDWEDVAATVGPGFTAQYCRHKAQTLWQYSDLAGGNMQLDRVAITQRVMKHHGVLALQGRYAKVSKKPKSSHKAVEAFQAKVKVGASFLSKVSGVAE